MERTYSRGGQGTTLTHPTGRLERARGETIDKNGTANDSVKDLDPPDKIVTEAHFGQGSEEERPVDEIEVFS